MDRPRVLSSTQALLHLLTFWSVKQEANRAANYPVTVQGTSPLVQGTGTSYSAMWINKQKVPKGQMRKCWIQSAAVAAGAAGVGAAAHVHSTTLV